MSKTQSQPQSRFVELDECARMRQRFHEEGASLHEVCDEFERAYSTVSKHCGGGCRHEGTDTLLTAEDAIGAVTDFAASMDPQRIPTQTEWRYQKAEDKPCSAKRLKTTLGVSSWSGVIQACGYPDLPRNTSKTFRATLYESPEIMEVTH